ncbi:unnamed protein product [Durusdinium trenchii]|uniref:EF-hand domain-containing protein n=1 Tax=Durusdinium trenchii TaxID=1381693 RepID=A0ABP0NEE2_9DINO
MAEQSLSRLRWRYFSETILPWRFALWKAWTYVRTFLLAYLLVLMGQLVMCAIERGEEAKELRSRLDLQAQLKAELSNETYSRLLKHGFAEVREGEDLAWDFSGVFHSRSFMYSFTLVASIGYGDLYPRTDGGKIFCIFFTLLATPALVVAYLFAARKSIDFMRFLALLMDEQNIRTFHKYDKDESGQLNSNEFKVALHDLGYRVTDDDVRLIMEEVNICDTTLVTIEEFGQAMILLQYPDAKYKKIRQTAMLVALVNLSWVLIGTICFMHLESWTFVESLWFCWETLMTIGLGDLVPHTEAGRPLAKGFWLVHLVARSIS